MPQTQSPPEERPHSTAYDTVYQTKAEKNAACDETTCADVVVHYFVVAEADRFRVDVACASDEQEAQASEDCEEDWNDNGCDELLSYRFIHHDSREDGSQDGCQDGVRSRSETIYERSTAQTRQQ